MTSSVHSWYFSIVVRCVHNKSSSTCVSLPRNDENTNKVFSAQCHTLPMEMLGRKRHRQFHWVTDAVTLRATVRWEEALDRVSVFHLTCAVTKYSSFLSFAISAGSICYIQIEFHPDWIFKRIISHGTDRISMNPIQRQSICQIEFVNVSTEWEEKRSVAMSKSTIKSLLDVRRMESMQRRTKLV